MLNSHAKAWGNTPMRDVPIKDIKKYLYLFLFDIIIISVKIDAPNAIAGSINSIETLTAFRLCVVVKL